MITCARKHCPWKTHLDRVINQLKEAGIIEQWLKEEFNPKIFLHETKAAKEDPMKLIHVSFALFLLCLGLILGTLSFVIEKLSVCKTTLGKTQNSLVSFGQPTVAP